MNTENQSEVDEELGKILSSNSLPVKPLANLYATDSSTILGADLDWRQFTGMAKSPAGKAITQPESGT